MSLHLLQKIETNKKNKERKVLVFLVSLPHGQSPDLQIATGMKLVTSAVGECEWSVLFNLLRGAFKEENNQNTLPEGKNTVKLVLCPRKSS